MAFDSAKREVEKTIKGQDPEVVERIERRKGLFLGHQRRWCEDRDNKVWQASRQAGKTYALTFDATTETGLSKRPIESVMGSASARQVYKAGREIRKHIKVLDILTEGLFRSEKENTETIVFPGGRILNLVPANPDTTAGFSGNVYLDEFALHKDARAIWKAIFPSITRGYKIRVTSTHRGRKTKFFELTQNQAYSQHKTTIYDAVREGLDLRDETGEIITPEQLRVLLADEDAWTEEYLVIPSDEAAAWISHEMLAGIEDEAIDHLPDWAEQLVAAAVEAQRYFRQYKTDPADWQARSRQITEPLLADDYQIDLGMDIGRNRDLSVIWLLRRGTFAKRTLAVIDLAKMEFRIQRYVLFALLTHVVRTGGRACIDCSGIGRQLAEEAAEMFGGLVEQIDFTQGNKEVLAVGLKDCVQDLAVLIPPEQHIRRSIHSVKKMVTATGKARFDAERTEKTGHADHFWALALAVHASAKPSGEWDVATANPFEFGKIIMGYSL